MRIKSTPTRGADPSPMAYEERAPEQVRPDFHAVVPPLIPFGPNSDERNGFLKQWELHGSGATRVAFPAIAHDALIAHGERRRLAFLKPIRISPVCIDRVAGGSLSASWSADSAGY
jgi:hypothetical protein